MDENFDPNGAVHRPSGAGSSKPSKEVADEDAPLVAVLSALEDGQVAIAGDVVAIRAGPETYHPVKALKGMASESDVIILSCLTKAPAAGEATSAVRSALQHAVVRPPSVMTQSPGPGGRAAAAGGAGVAPTLRAISPSSYSAVVDSNLLRAFTATRARMILAGLTPPPPGGSETRTLPTVVAGVSRGPDGLCFLGQRATPEGHSSFSFRRDSEQEAAGGRAQALRIDDLVHEYGGRAHASARALYDLWGNSNGDFLGECLQEGGKSSPFARLATEWDCSTHATRTLGSAPPPACSSLLLIGGECPPTTVSAKIRGDIETLTTAVARGTAPQQQARRKAKGPFGGGRGDTGRDEAPPGGASASGVGEEQERRRWDEDLQALLSGSENMAELATKSVDTPAGAGGGSNDASEAGTAEEDTAVQDRTDGGGLGEEEVGSGLQELPEKVRGDLDFSERLWELAARATDVEGVRSAVALAFDAVGEGQIFPVISRDSKTAVGCHIRDGVAMAREARYQDGTSACLGDEAKAKAWRERGSALLADEDALASAFVELGVHKVARDLLHWLEAYAGVLAADVDRALPATAPGGGGGGGGGRPAPRTGDNAAGDRRLDRLLTLADTLDLVALAQSYGAPWRQLAHPVFWELYLEPAGGSGVGGAMETVSYTLANAGLFQLNGLDEPPALSGEAARAAQAALSGCPARLIPEVLSSVTGAESFVELKRRLLEHKAKGARVRGDAVFVCEHSFIPW
ncbi:unnamed protein product [Ectocarpus fasciculatus]